MRRRRVGSTVLLQRGQRAERHNRWESSRTQCSPERHRTTTPAGRPVDRVVRLIYDTRSSTRQYISQCNRSCRAFARSQTFHLHAGTVPRLGAAHL